MALCSSCTHLHSRAPKDDNMCSDSFYRFRLWNALPPKRPTNNSIFFRCAGLQAALRFVFFMVTLKREIQNRGLEGLPLSGCSWQGIMTLGLFQPNPKGNPLMPVEVTRQVQGISDMSSSLETWSRICATVSWY